MAEEASAYDMDELVFPYVSFNNSQYMICIQEKAKDITRLIDSYCDKPLSHVHGEWLGLTYTRYYMHHMHFILINWLPRCSRQYIYINLDDTSPPTARRELGS